MKLRNKKTGEIVNAIFEPCEGNVKIINKDKPNMWGEYASIRAIRAEWQDVLPKYESQYRYAKSEKGKAKKKEANRRYYLKHRSRKNALR